VGGRPRARGLTLFAVAVVVAILVAIAIVLSHSANRRTGLSAAQLDVGFFLPPGRSFCQPDQEMSAGTGYLTFYAKSSAAGAGPLRVTVRDAAGRVLAGATAPPRRYGPQARAVPNTLSARLPALSRATVCIANAGPSQVAIWGGNSRTSRTELVGPGGRRSAHAVLRLDYFSAARRSWWSLAPDVEQRFGLVKATFFGAWTFWVAIVALLVVCLGSVLYAGRALRR
jgi:hypothetical protein